MAAHGPSPRSQRTEWLDSQEEGEVGRVAWGQLPPPETLFPHLEDVGVAWNASEAPAAQPCLQGSGQAGVGGPVLCPLGLWSGLATLGRRMLCVGVIDWLQKWPRFFTCTPHPGLLQ